MIKFFRKIRRKMISENKFSKYMIYAIGEIVLVVIGILIALSINNWNESRKKEDQRQILIASLIEDFEYTYTDIVTDEMPYLNSLQEDIERFQDLSSSALQLVPVDTLRNLASAFFRPNSFNPNLTAYNEAVSSGNLGLLNNKDLMIEFTRFMQFLKSYYRQENQSSYSYYNGASWEFRKTVDPNILYGKSKSNISYKDYQTLIRTPLALNTFKNHNSLNKSMYNELRIMSKITERILELLKEMQID